MNPHSNLAVSKYVAMVAVIPGRHSSPWGWWMRQDRDVEPEEAWHIGDDKVAETPLPEEGSDWSAGGKKT